MIKIGPADIVRVELVFNGRAERLHSGEVVVEHGGRMDPWTFIVRAKKTGERPITIEQGASYVDDVMRGNMLFVVDPRAEVRGNTGKGILRATMTAAAKQRVVDLVEHGIGIKQTGGKLRRYRSKSPSRSRSPGKKMKRSKSPSLYKEILKYRRQRLAMQKRSSK